MSEHARPNVVAIVASLIDGWCERRCLIALRLVLPAWPIRSGLTDEWAVLAEALERVRAFAKDDLTPSESQRVEDAIHELRTSVSK